MQIEAEHRETRIKQLRWHCFIVGVSNFMLYVWLIAQIFPQVFRNVTKSDGLQTFLFEWPFLTLGVIGFIAALAWTTAPLLFDYSENRAKLKTAGKRSDL